MNIKFICKGCGVQFNNNMLSCTAGYCYICNEFYMKQYIFSLKSELANLEDDHNKLIDQYNKQYNDLCKEIQFHSSARERLVKKVKDLEAKLAERKEFCISQTQSLLDINKALIEENNELKQQLADK